jgi:hypothetical protein
MMVGRHGDRLDTWIAAVDADDQPDLHRVLPTAVRPRSLASRPTPSHLPPTSTGPPGRGYD